MHLGFLADKEVVCVEQLFTPALRGFLLLGFVCFYGALHPQTVCLLEDIVAALPPFVIIHEVHTISYGKDRPGRALHAGRRLTEARCTVGSTLLKTDGQSEKSNQ